jgi:3-carboxy-cis,cis-muconate cycloisomerase
LTSNFASIFVPPAIQAAVADGSWLAAMLEAETALATAEADAGLISADAAAAVAAACRDAIVRAAPAAAAWGRDAVNPVVPLARALRERAPEAHFGATSQDILDTAAMLVARRARALILDELDAVVAACARLADEHRETVMAGRTLMQHAQPVTFGLKAAGWLSGVAAARDALRAVPLAAQLGGPAGTLGGLGTGVLARFAAELDLAEPPLPWHGDRTRVAALGAALAIAAGACEKVALDIVLLAQNEVGEVAETGESGRGGSSSMAHKHNPVGAVRARAAARSVRGAAGVLLEAMAGEHERAAGAWQSEWGALSAALAGAGGAAWSLREALEGLTIDAARMRANLEGLPGDLDQTTVNELIDRALAADDPATSSRAHDPTASSGAHDPTAS